MKLTTSYCSLRPMGDMAAMGEGLIVIIMGEGLMLIIPPCIMSNNSEETQPRNKNCCSCLMCAHWSKSRLLVMQEHPCRRQVQFT